MADIPHCFSLLRNMLQLQRASGCDPPGDIKAETMMMPFVNPNFVEIPRHKISATLCNRHQVLMSIRRYVVYKAGGLVLVHELQELVRVASGLNFQVQFNSVDVSVKAMLGEVKTKQRQGKQIKDT